MYVLQLIFDLITDPAVVAWFGAICGHMLSLYSDDFKGTQPFLRKLVPCRKDTFYIRVDLFLLPIIGAILSVILLEPNNLKSALTAGLTWSGTLKALLDSKKS